jgi:membrane-associated phospholipid phosphatase
MHERTTFWGWPGWSNIVYGYGLLGLPLFLFFVLIYGGADYLTGLHGFRVPLHLSFELDLPFVPAMIVFYNSLHFVYLMTGFVLRTRQEIRAIVIVWFCVTLIGGFIFLLLPAEDAYPTPTDAELGPWRGMFRPADRANLHYNSCPSLHVAWAIVGVDIFARRAQVVGKTLLWIWGVCMMVSTVLLHQHHLVDVLGGFSLALLATRILYPRVRDGRVFPPRAAGATRSSNPDYS